MHPSREPGSPQPALLLSFSGAYSTVDPSAFDMPDAPENEAGVFIFEGGSQSKVKFISSPTEIPTGQTFVLVKYGEESGQTRNSLGLTIAVARNQSKTVSDLSFLANIHTAKEIAKRENISNIFALK